MRNKKLIILLTVVLVLVLIVVICCATFLVRNVYAYSYYGYGDGGTVDYDEKIIEAADIKKNSSMFFVDEKGIKSRVEDKFPNVCIINVERRFPDIVVINYVVYENSFQYAVNGKYYQCYASGRIGGMSAEPAPRSEYFTVIPRGTVSTTVGAYFQGDGGFDRNVIDAFIAYMHNKGMNDRQINERINFIDLSRDGYVYIRTAAGCNIELKGDANEFAALMERGWSLFADPNPDSAITSKESGLIRVWMSHNGDPHVMSTYTARGAEFGVDEEGNPKYYSDVAYYEEYYRGGK